MASEKHWVDKEHYRTVSDNGKRSYLYEAGFFGDTCVEIAKHHADGTTDAYEVGGVLDHLFGDGTGRHK